MWFSQTFSMLLFVWTSWQPIGQNSGWIVVSFGARWDLFRIKALAWGAGDVWTSVSKGRIRDALWRHRCSAETISPGIMKPRGASGVWRWAPDIDCHSKRWGEWRFIFSICMRRCATIKAQLALRRQWFAFTNHVGSVLIASTSGRGAPLSPRARCLRSFVSPSFLIDYTLTIFHSPPGFSGHLNEFPNAAPPHPVLFSRTPDGISPHICIVQKECPKQPPRDVPASWQILPKFF